MPILDFLIPLQQNGCMTKLLIPIFLLLTVVSLAQNTLSVSSKSSVHTWVYKISVGKPTSFTGRIFARFRQPTCITLVGSFRYKPPALQHGNCLFAKALGSRLRFELYAAIPAGCSYKDKLQAYSNNELHREYFRKKLSIFCSSLKKGE
jgi:hypothetical protein